MLHNDVTRTNYSDVTRNLTTRKPQNEVPKYSNR